MIEIDEVNAGEGPGTYNLPACQLLKLPAWVVTIHHVWSGWVKSVCRLAEWEGRAVTRLHPGTAITGLRDSLHWTLTVTAPPPPLTLLCSITEINQQGNCLFKVTELCWLKMNASCLTSLRLERENNLTISQAPAGYCWPLLGFLFLTS